MIKIVIREAAQADVDAIYEIFSPTDQLHREAHPEIFQQAQFPEEIKEYYRASILNPNSTILLAEDENVIVGVTICSLETTAEIPILVPRKYVCIENITVAEKYYHHGVGKALIETAQQWASAHGASRIELTVWEFNQGAANFYQKLGFRTLRRRMVKDL